MKFTHDIATDLEARGTGEGDLANHTVNNLAWSSINVNVGANAKGKVILTEIHGYVQAGTQFVSKASVEAKVCTIRRDASDHGTLWIWKDQLA